jgi:hypothetical protein
MKDSLLQYLSICRAQLRLRNLWALAGVTLLAACVSTAEAPTQALLDAEKAISTADQAGVDDYASVDLTEARAKLVSAHEALRKEEMVTAGYLAEESRMAAEVATAKAESVKAKAVNDEMKVALTALKQEMQRNTGVQ